MADDDLGPRETLESKRIRQLTYVYKRLTIYPNALDIGEGLEVDVWCYMTLGKRAYVANQCVLSDELL